MKRFCDNNVFRFEIDFVVKKKNLVFPYHRPPHFSQTPHTISYLSFVRRPKDDSRFFLRVTFQVIEMKTVGDVFIRRLL